MIVRWRLRRRSTGSGFGRPGPSRLALAGEQAEGVDGFQSQDATRLTGIKRRVRRQSQGEYHSIADNLVADLGELGLKDALDLVACGLELFVFLGVEPGFDRWLLWTLCREASSSQTWPRRSSTVKTTLASGGISFCSSRAGETGSPA